MLLGQYKYKKSSSVLGHDEDLMIKMNRND